MTRLAPPRPLAETDDRDSFDCGRESMNAWFRRHAWSNQVNRLSRVSVVTDTEIGRIAGLVTLSACQIERTFLPKPLQRNRPEAIPAFLLGQLAVDRAYQGQRLAASLMFFALGTAWRGSAEIGCMGVLTHPIDDAVRGLYARWGFKPLPFDPKQSMFVHMVDLELILGQRPGIKGIG